MTTNVAPTSQLPGLFGRVRLVMIQPPNYKYSHAFDETIELFELALSALGSQVDRTVNDLLEGAGVNFIFGAHLLKRMALPPNSVIVNLEQIQGVRGIYWQFLKRIRRHPVLDYLKVLSQYPVLDYSARNAERIEKLTGNPHVHLFKMGTMPAITRIPSTPHQDIDVLFYGTVNKRRRKILRGLAGAGLTIKTLTGAYGKERDAWIARSKIVLNVHYYKAKIHELVRTSYLMANGKAVVSECEPDTEIDADVRQALIAVPYDKIVETCVALVRDDARRHATEQQASTIFTRRNQALLLAEILPGLAQSLSPQIKPGNNQIHP